MLKLIKDNYIIAGLLGVGVAFYLYYLITALRWLTYPESIDFGEGFVMKYAEMWAAGTWKWDITVPPYLTMVYGLGYPVLMVPDIKLLGSGIEVGRTGSFLSALAVSFLLYLIVRHLTGRKIFGLIAALLPATQPIFRDWSVMARVDMPAMMFEMAGLYLLIRFKDSRWVYLAIAPFIIAMTIKLTAVAGLVAAMIYLLLKHRVRFVIFSGSAIGICGLLFTFAMSASGGEYWKHALLYQNTIQNLDIPIFMVNWQMFIYAFIPLLVPTLMYLKKCIKDREFNLIAMFFAVAFILNMIATFRPGAAGMYYYETILGGAVCATLAFYYMTKKLASQSGFVLAIAIAFIAMFGVRTTMPFPNDAYRQDTQVVESMLQDTARPVVTENPTLVMNAGKELYIEPFIFSNLARLGYWDDSNYIKQYQEQYFDYVLLKVSLEQKRKYESMGFIDDKFTGETLDEIEDNYTLVYSNEKPDTYTNPAEDWRCVLNLYEANRRVK